MSGRNSIPTRRQVRPAKRKKYSAAQDSKTLKNVTSHYNRLKDFEISSDLACAINCITKHETTADGRVGSFDQAGLTNKTIQGSLIPPVLSDAQATAGIAPLFNGSLLMYERECAPQMRDAASFVHHPKLMTVLGFFQPSSGWACTVASPRPPLGLRLATWSSTCGDSAACTKSWCSI